MKVSQNFELLKIVFMERSILDSYDIKTNDERFGQKII